MGKLLAWIDERWQTSRVLATILVLLGVCTASWAYTHLQSPGVSIGLLALVAGIMSVRPPTMHILERLCWVGILVFLARLEVGAIRRADEVSTAKNQAILDGMTGGDSYVSIGPQSVNADEFALLATVVGKNTVWDAEVYTDAKPVDVKTFPVGFNPMLVYKGSFSSTYSASVGNNVHPEKNRINTYTFRTYSRNLPTMEILRIKFDPSVSLWLFSMQIFRSPKPPKIDEEFLTEQNWTPIPTPRALPIFRQFKQPM